MTHMDMDADLDYDAIIIGAGPAGTTAAALLRQQGYRVCLFEREQFPRFSIGESLLAYASQLLKEAGLLSTVQAGGFQIKNGAAFQWGTRQEIIPFDEKFSDGPSDTYQVPRAKFDLLLADAVQRLGATVRYRHRVDAFDYDDGVAHLTVTDLNRNTTLRLRSRVVLDASGSAGVLARLLDLSLPPTSPPRAAVFTHIEDRIDDAGFDRAKTWITLHPEHPTVWFWLIPFTQGRASLGVVGDIETIIDTRQSPQDRLRHFVDTTPSLRKWLTHAVWDSEVLSTHAYARRVKRLYGPGYVLLGNAAEFIDPLFSSGVTIAMKSASLAAHTLHRQWQGQTVDWQSDYTAALEIGIRAFRNYVDAWYEGSFQHVLFSAQATPTIRAMISAILAGYAWDTRNPYVATPARFHTLAQFAATGHSTS